jgi:hypothetical protein
VLAVALTFVPGVVHADAAGPTDYRSVVESITPATDAIRVSIEGGDSFVRLAVDPGHEVTVLGYDDEPYLLIDAEGTVYDNTRSLATYYNTSRYGNDDTPDIVDATAPPEWVRIGAGGAWAWHDHRAHWMGGQPPIGMAPGDSFPVQVVPIVVDGTRVEIGIRTTLQPDPSPWPMLFGLLIGLQLALLPALAGPASAALGALVLAAMSLVVGIAEYRSLPGETGPLVTWWLLPAIAVGCLAATIAMYGRSVLVERALVALAGAQLFVWGLERRSGLSKALLPTDLPFWLDRVVTAAALTGGAAVALSAIRSMLRPPAAPRVTQPA